VIYPKKFFPNEDVPYLFASCDVVLFPYYEEDRSASGSLHLAFGAGRPVVASRIPKFEELKEISDELLVLPYNSRGIAQVVLRILKDERFRTYIEERTRAYAQRTSWPEVARRHMQVYHSLLAGRSAAEGP